MPQDAAGIVGFLIGSFIGACIGSLIGAVFLRAAAKWVLRLDVPFGRAYTTVLMAYTLSFVIGFVVGIVAGLSGSAALSAAAPLAMLPVGFLIQSGVTGWRLNVTFGKAMLVSLVAIALGVGVALAVVLVVIAVMGGVGALR